MRLFLDQRSYWFYFVIRQHWGSPWSHFYAGTRSPAGRQPFGLRQWERNRHCNRQVVPCRSEWESSREEGSDAPAARLCEQEVEMHRRHLLVRCFVQLDVRCFWFRMTCWLTKKLFWCYWCFYQWCRAKKRIVGTYPETGYCQQDLTLIFTSLFNEIFAFITLKIKTWKKCGNAVPAPLVSTDFTDFCVAEFKNALHFSLSGLVFVLWCAHCWKWVVMSKRFFVTVMVIKCSRNTKSLRRNSFNAGSITRFIVSIC